MNRLIGMVVFFGGLLLALAGLSALSTWPRAGSRTCSPSISARRPRSARRSTNVLTLMLVVMMIAHAPHGGRAQVVGDDPEPDRPEPAKRCSGHALGGIPYLAADALKMLTKEGFRPAAAPGPLQPGAHPRLRPGVRALRDRPGGPADPAAPSSIGHTGRWWPWWWPRRDFGLLYLFAIASLAVYGTSLAGWASNNKFALLGGVRASSQMISYEVALGLSLVGMMIAFSTLRLDAMVVAQGHALPVGGLESCRPGASPAAGGLPPLLRGAFAETKRAPFDLPEGETEIIGYFVEYSGMQFGLFLAEFVEIVVLSGDRHRGVPRRLAPALRRRVAAQPAVMPLLVRHDPGHRRSRMKVMLSGCSWPSAGLPALPLRPDPDARLEDPPAPAW